MTKKLFLAFALLFAPSAAFAQCNGVFPSNTICGTIAGGIPSSVPFSNFGSVFGPGSSTAGNVPLWNNTTGTLLNDSGIAGTFKQPSSTPANTTLGHSLCATDSDCYYGNPWSQYPFGVVSTNPIMIGKAGSSIGSNSIGQIFRIVFTSTGLVGSPITISYTAIGGDTTTTIAVALCAGVNANSTLHGLGGKPIFCQSVSAGVFNLQYDAAFGSTGATPLTTATTGSTGTISLAAEQLPLDFILSQFGRNVSGRAAITGDGIHAFDFSGQDSTGVYNTHYAQITASIVNPTAGATRGLIGFSTAGNAGGPIGRAGIQQGLYLYDSAGALPTGGDVGPGIINLPTTGGFYLGGGAVALNGALYGVNVFGGVAAGSTLNLQSTQSGSPSGDFVQVTSGGSVRQKWFSDGGVTYGAATGNSQGAGTINIAGSSFFSNGVDVADNTAWAAFTPSPTCGTATITTQSARTKTLGKTTYVQLEETITAIGTCGVTNVTFNLPKTAQSGGGLVGREITSNIGVDCLILTSGTTGACLRVNGATWNVNDHFIVSGVYENQ